MEVKKTESKYSITGGLASRIERQRRCANPACAKSIISVETIYESTKGAPALA